MLASANLWVFIKWPIGLNLDQFLPVSVNLSKFTGFYKEAYWLKSGPFLVENLSRPIRGPASNISWQFWGKEEKNSFDF
jgi:hypothetical protein